MSNKDEFRKKLEEEFRKLWTERIDYEETRINTLTQKIALLESEIDKVRIEKEEYRFFHRIWTALVAFLVGISVYFTLSSFLLPSVGIILIIASLATLGLYVISIRK